MRKFVPILILVLIGVVVVTILYFRKTQLNTANLNQSTHPIGTSISSPSPNTKVQDEIFKNALNLYLRKKEEGVDMSNGPCLGKIGEDWVLDIAHNPRQPVDDESKNQCEDYREGRAHHFIELDPNGKLITIN